MLAAVHALFYAEIMPKPSFPLLFSGKHMLCFGLVMLTQSHNLASATSNCLVKLSNPF